MPRNSSERRQTGDTRDLILEAALRLFSRDGYFSTSVHDIRREADVSIGSIYHHFPGKEAIAKALYDDLVARLSEAVAAVAERHDTARNRCRAVVGHLFALTEEQPEAMEFVLHARHRDFLPDEPPICSSRPFAMMMAMVEEGIAAGEIVAGDPVVVAASLFGGAIRMIHLRLDGVLERPLPEQIEALWACAWRGVAA